MPGGYKLPFFACKGAVVNHEVHCHCRFVDFQKRERSRVFGVCYGLADFHVSKTRNGNNITGTYFCCFNSFEPFKGPELADSDLLQGPISSGKADGLACRDDAAGDSADAYSADIIVVVQGGYLKLKGLLIRTLRCGNLFADQFKERTHA